jgi:hypothetical protein
LIKIDEIKLQKFKNIQIEKAQEKNVFTITYIFRLSLNYLNLSMMHNFVFILKKTLIKFVYDA